MFATYSALVALKLKTSSFLNPTASVADKFIAIFRTNVKFIFSLNTLVIIVAISILKIHLIEQHISRTLDTAAKL